MLSLQKRSSTGRFLTFRRGKFFTLQADVWTFISSQDWFNAYTFCVVSANRLAGRGNGSISIEEIESNRTT